HLLEVVRSLDGPVHSIHAFQEPEMGLPLLLRPHAFRHVHGGADVLDELAGGAEHGMADDVDALYRSVRKNDAVIHLIVHPLTGRLVDDVANPPSVLRMNAPANVVRRRSSALRNEAKQAEIFLGCVGWLPGADIPPPAAR